MEITYKMGENLLVFIPGILGFIYKEKINEFVMQYIFWIRLAFGASILADLLTAFLIKKAAQKRKIKTKVAVPQNDYLLLPPKEKEETNNEGGSEAEPEVEMPLWEYDSKLAEAHVTKTLANALICIILHIFLKTTQPILMQILNYPKNVFFFPLYIEYLQRRPMLRPFSANILLSVGEKKPRDPTAHGEEARREEKLKEPEGEAEEASSTSSASISSSTSSGPVQSKTEEAESRTESKEKKGQEKRHKLKKEE